MSTLERAIAIAAEAHAGQRDKAGAPYILHPLRVMGRMATDDERIVAVLHDLVEDTAWTIERLRDEGFGAQILDAVDALTHREGETYEQFVERAARNALGRRVKIADLEDNADLSRIAQPTERDLVRAQKYKSAIAQLRGDQRVAFGCERCWPGDADAAWGARDALKSEIELIDESHFHVMVLKCMCGQRFLAVFTERIDWVHGDDPQSWTTLPLTASEAADLARRKGSLDEAALRDIGRDRRSLRRDHPSGEAGRNFWDTGMVVEPHD